MPGQGQDLAQQRAALRGAGCSRVFEEKVSGAKRDRPQLERLLDHLRVGDVVAVTRLDRLARSTRDLLEIAERIKDAGAGLRSIAEPWADTTTPAGRMVLTVFAGIADFERSLIVEQYECGPCRCEAQGIRFGPHPSLGAEQIAHARQLIQQGRQTGWPRLPTSRRPSFADEDAGRSVEPYPSFVTNCWMIWACSALGNGPFGVSASLAMLLMNPSSKDDNCGSPFANRTKSRSHSRWARLSGVSLLFLGLQGFACEAWGQKLPAAHRCSKAAQQGSGSAVPAI